MRDQEQIAELKEALERSEEDHQQTKNDFYEVMAELEIMRARASHAEDLKERPR